MIGNLPVGMFWGEKQWDEDTEHSSGNSWRVWLFLGCLEILESWHSTDKAGPLRNRNSGFISSYCDAENSSDFPQFPLLPFILHFIRLHISFLFHHSTTAAKARAPLYCMSSKSLPHWGFHGLEFSQFLGWELQSPHQKTRDILSQAQASAEKHPISSLSKIRSVH